MEHFAISAAGPAAGLMHSPALGAEHPGGAVAARHLPGLDLLRFASVVGLV